MLTSSSKLKQATFLSHERTSEVYISHARLLDLSTSRLYTSEKILNNINVVVWKPGK